MLRKILYITTYLLTTLNVKSQCDSFDLMITAANPLCPGFCDGSVTVTPSGGTGLVDGQLTAADGSIVLTGIGTCPNPLCAGWYYIYVFDEAGCEIYDSVLLVDPDEMEIIMNVTLPTSESACDGIAEVDTVLFHNSNYLNLGFYWSPGGPGGVGQTVKSDLCFGDYSITVNNEIGCGAILNFTVGNLSTQEKNRGSTLNIFPNPATEWIILESASMLNEIILFDVSGNELLHLSRAGGQELIDVRNLSNGIYFLKIQIEDYIEYKAFVKSANF